MKKFWVSSLLCIIVILLIDFIGYLFVIQDCMYFVPEEEKATVKFPSWFENRFRMYDETTIRWFKENQSVRGFREPVLQEGEKKNIWLFGCSFVYGVGMVNGDHPIEDTFGYILSKDTGKNVYNRAYPSWGMQHMLYQLKDENTYKELPEPQYVIYTFINDHARRTQKIVYDPWSDGEYLRYKVGKDGKLEKINAVLTPFWKFYPVKLWLGHLEYKIRLAEEHHDSNFDLLKQMLVESKDILKSKYPNTKFVILKYNGADGFDRWFIETERWNELSEEDGFIVVDADKLVNKNLQDKEFLDPDGYHPNPEAWKLISKALSKKVLKD